MFTDGLTNKLVGGWKDGFKEDLVLVRSSDIVYTIWFLFRRYMIGPSRKIRNTQAYKIQGVWRQDGAIHWSRRWGDVMTMQRLFSPQLHLSYILYSIGSVCVDDQSIKTAFCLLRKTKRLICWLLLLSADGGRWRTWNCWSREETEQNFTQPFKTALLMRWDSNKNNMYPTLTCL